MIRMSSLGASVAFAAMCVAGTLRCGCADQLAIGLGAGTLGVAVSVSKPVAPRTALRLTFGSFELSRRDGFDNVVIDILTRLRLTEKFRVQSAGLYIDRSIRARTHVTFGAVLNQNRISAVSIPADSSIVINNYVYSAAKAGEIFTTVRWMPVAPYVGFGFGPRATDRRRLALVGEFGAFYEGRAKVTFDSNGVIKANESNFIRYFNTLEGQLSHELSPVQVFPVVQIGLRLKM